MSEKYINDLFITNDVRDYIKNINDNIKNGYTVTTNAIGCILYTCLCLFIHMVFKIDIITTVDIFKNYIKYLLSYDKNDTLEDTKKKINILREYLKIISLIYDSNHDETFYNDSFEELIKYRISNNSKNLQLQNNIIDKLVKLFDNYSKRNIDNELNNKIKKAITDNPEDGKLFLEFFDIVKCNNLNCEDIKIIYDYNDKDARFTLKKNNNVIKLLEVFNGKSVKIIVNNIDLEAIEKFNEYIIQRKKNIIKKCVKKTIEELNNQNTTQKGGGDYDKFENVFNKIGIDINSGIETMYNNINNLFNINWLNPATALTISKIGINNLDINKSIKKSIKNYDNTKNIGQNVRTFTDNARGKISNNVSKKWYYLQNIQQYAYTYLSGVTKNFIGESSNSKDSIISSIEAFKNNIFKEYEKDSDIQLNLLKNFGLLSSNTIAIPDDVYKNKLVKSLSFSGGGIEKCFIIQNLKQDMLKILINITNYCMIGISYPKNFIDCSISLNKSFNITIVKINKLSCLKQTNLFSSKKVDSTNLLKAWDNTYKNINSSIQYTPTCIDILKDSTINEFNLKGGTIGDEKANKNFINTMDKDIYLSYSYQIINLFEKLLKMINNNKIYLTEEEITRIQTHINILKNMEKKLLKNANNIIQAIKMGDYVLENNKILNEESLEEYINENNILLNNANHRANSLGHCFIKILDMT